MRTDSQSRGKGDAERALIERIASLRAPVAANICTATSRLCRTELSCRVLLHRIPDCEWL